MLAYPPGDSTRKIKNKYLYNNSDIIPYTMKACNDLGYMAATARNAGNKVFLKDYKIQNASALDFIDDVLQFAPDMIVLSTSIHNVFEDLKLVRIIRSSNPHIAIVLKSEMFFDSSEELLCSLHLGAVDYLIGSDAAFVLPLLITAHFENQAELYKIPFITICKNGSMTKTNFHAPHGNINDLPFPARDLMKNEYYYRPDTKQVIATINVSRGCEQMCMNCNQAKTSNSTLYLRSAKNVFEEILECYSKYGIRCFFFPDDNFTYDEKWVEELCDYIMNSQMAYSVHWIANVNISKFTEYMATLMKDAGCTNLIMRFESGSDDTLLKMKKGYTVDECLNAVSIARKAKLSVFGIFTIGLPWENMEHLKATRKVMFKIGADVISLALPVPYPGTRLEQCYKDFNMLKEPLFQQKGLKIPILGSKFLTYKDIRRFRRKTILLYYIYPVYMFRKLIEIAKKPSLFSKYFNFFNSIYANKRG